MAKNGMISYQFLENRPPPASENSPNLADYPPAQGENL